MLVRDITFKDFEGNEHTRTYHFNISKAELAEMEIGKAKGGGYRQTLLNLVEAKDGEAIVREVKALILGSIGVRSGDGINFYKNDEIRNDFYSSPAYEVIFLEMVSDAEAMANFVNKVVPPDIAEAVAARRAGTAPAGATQPQDYKPSAREIAEQARETAISQVVQNGIDKAPQPAEGAVAQPDPRDIELARLRAQVAAQQSSEGVSDSAE